MPRSFAPVLLTSLVLLVAALCPSAAHAQRGRYGQGGPRSAQALAAGLWQIDFAYNGRSDTLARRYDYAGAAYGVVFTRPNFLASFAVGNSAPDPAIQEPGEDLRLIDAALFTWADLYTLLESGEGQRRLTIPLALHSSYRRVAQALEEEEDEITDAFGVTVFGLGTGLVFTGELGRSAFVEARAMPVIGLATRSIGDANGTARLLDLDAQLHLGPIAGRLGLSAGYNFRWQVWNVGTSDLFEAFAPDYFDYKGTHHGFRVGVSF